MALRVIMRGAIALALAAAIEAIFLPKRHPARRPDPILVPIIAKPRGDKREYQTGMLPNGIQVVNVFDNKSLYSAFSVAVTAGSYDDPEQFAGLAHFCEHMVFLGNQKYPEVDSFDKFVASRGGYNNAYTRSDLTNYFMQVASSASEEGLDRIAHLVQKPLFRREYVFREVHAIESEHMKNLKTTARYVMSTMNSLSSPASPVGKFATGNLKTLFLEPESHGKHAVDALRTFFKTNYCPSRFKLATFGPEPLSVQFNRALKSFGYIPRGSEKCNEGPTNYSTPTAWPASSLAKWVDIQGTESSTTLWIFFPILDWSSSYAAAPVHYLQWMFSYGGEDSLSQVLSNALGLATGIQCDSDSSSAGNSLWLIVSLTPAGRRHPDKVLDVIFSYIAKMRRRGVNLELYESLALKSQLDFDWSEPGTASDVVSSLSAQLAQVAPQDILWARNIIRKPDAALVQRIVSQLRPANMNTAIVDKDLDLSTGIVTHQLPHYNITYAVRNLSAMFEGAQSRWTKWVDGTIDEKTIEAQLLSQLHKAGVKYSGRPFPRLPSAIRGIQTNFSMEHMHVGTTVNDSSDVHSGSVSTRLYGPLPRKVPHPVFGEDRVYVRSGWMTSSPTVSFKVMMRPLYTEVNEERPVSDHARLSVLSALLHQDLSPKIFDQAAAGASYELDLSTDGIELSFAGYTPAMPSLIKGVMHGLHRGVNASDPVVASLFARIKTTQEQVLTTYADMPYAYALQERNLVLTHGTFSREEQLAAVSNLTLSSTSTAAQSVLFAQPLRATALVMGNVDPSEAMETTTKIINSARAGSAAPSNSTARHVHYISPILNITHSVELRRPNPKVGDPNYVTVVSYLAGVSTIKRRAMLAILEDVIKPIAYQYLRTELQLGYVVDAGAGIMSNIQYLSVVVQGNAKPADEVEAHIEYVFSKQVPEILQNMSSSEFLTYKRSFQDSVLSTPLGVSSEFAHHWGWIDEGGRCPLLLDELLNVTHSVTSKQQLIDMYNSVVFPHRGHRQRIVTKLFPQSVTVPKRPTKERQMSTLKQAGVPASALQRLEQEYDPLVVLTTADSKSREMLAKKNSYYPTDIVC